MPNVTFMIGISISWFQVPVYIAEIAPQDQRGALGSVNQVVFFIVNDNILLMLFMRSLSSDLSMLLSTSNQSIISFTALRHNWYIACLPVWHVCSLENSCCSRYDVKL